MDPRIADHLRRRTDSGASTAVARQSPPAGPQRGDRAAQVAPTLHRQPAQPSDPVARPATRRHGDRATKVTPALHRQPAQPSDPRPRDEDPLTAGRRSAPGPRRRVFATGRADPDRDPLARPGPGPRPGRVRALLGGGHLVDPPQRTAPRFPQSQVPWVTKRVGEVLDAWRVGAGTTVVTGGARGADILIAEEAHARGAALHVCLALPPEEFEHTSVHLPDTVWTGRFRRLLRLALRVEVLHAEPDEDAFARTNAWLIEIARELDPDPYAIVVWDGRPGDRPGGTADLVERLGYPVGDPRLSIIDPTPGRP